MFFKLLFCLKCCMNVLFNRFFRFVNVVVLINVVDVVNGKNNFGVVGVINFIVCVMFLSVFDNFYYCFGFLLYFCFLNDFAMSVANDFTSFFSIYFVVVVSGSVFGVFFIFSVISSDCVFIIFSMFLNSSDNSC